MKKSTARHIYWLVGGLIGVTLGILIGFYIIKNMDLPDPSLYIAVYRACAITVTISVLLGAAFGAVVGKLISFFKEVLKNEKQRKKR